jgi:hypothetical protein
MITKFSSLYAGHVDLGDLGQNATPANERRYSNDHLVSVFENVSPSMGMPKAVMLEQLTWFAREVMPAFAPATAAR